MESAPDRVPRPRRFSLRRRRAKSRAARARGCLAVLLTGVALIALLFTQASGAFGAQSADVLRAVLGAQMTAQIESWYLGLLDAKQQAQYKLSGTKTQAPWQVKTTPLPTATPAPAGKAPTAQLSPMALTPISPLISPPLQGEGVWVTDGLPAPAPGQPPFVAKTFLRPDPARPYAVATLLKFDMRQLTLHMVAGTTQPGGPLHVAGPGVIPAADQAGNLLVAAFNGGFKYADGQYGMMVGGVVYVPPKDGVATIAVTREDSIIMGAWGTDPRLTSTNPDLVAWRQNAALLIDHGVINPLTHDGAAWGGTVLNSAYTWRSGLGVTADGTLLYAAGNSLSAATLGAALHAAGAVTAMQTDINPFWVRAYTFLRSPTGTWQAATLHPGMPANASEYFHGTTRDFFYLTRRPPQPVQPRTRMPHR